MKRIRNISLLVVVFIATVLIVPMAAGVATSDRTLPASVDPGATFTVNMTVADYGSGGSVVETLPDGFTYVDSTLGDTQAEEAGNTVTFTLFDESSFDYTVEASGTNGTYVFSGIIKDSYKVESTIGGDTSITVGADVGDGPDASATRTLPATSVEPGIQFTVSMTVADYGSGGSVVETLPDGFTYVDSTLGDTQAEVAGNTVTFTLFDESNFDYTVEASGTDGTYAFSGVIKDSYKVEFAVTGDSSIDVVTPPEDVSLHEGWDFISIPCVLENSSVDSVLAGVAYDSLLYYNAETGVWETVSTFEPFKGYWINVSGPDQVILEDSLVKQEKQEPSEPGTKILVYEGWNAVGSDYEIDKTAEKTLISIDDSYSKIVDEYDVIGFNGVNHEDAEDGTLNYMMHPYEGYWVFVTQDGKLG